MKPLLEVTNNEEKLSQKEQELKTITDKFEKVKLEREELERQMHQVMEERGMLAQQFRAEAELCAETEEVSSFDSFVCHHSLRFLGYRIFLFISIYVSV